MPFTVYTIGVYTWHGMDEIEGFDWDAANVGHILRHAVTPSEVEEVAGRPHVTVRVRTIKGEQRWKLFGKTASPPLLGRGVHDSPQALPHRDRL